MTVFQKKPNEVCFENGVVCIFSDEEEKTLRIATEEERKNHFLNKYDIVNFEEGFVTCSKKNLSQKYRNMKGEIIDSDFEISKETGGDEFSKSVLEIGEKYGFTEKDINVLLTRPYVFITGINSNKIYKVKLID